MPRSLAVRLVIVVLVLVVALVTLSSLDSTKALTRVEKSVPDSALAR